MPEENERNNGWKKYEHYVLEELKEQKQDLRQCTTMITDIHKEMVGFKRDQKWALRIWSSTWAVILTALSVAVKKFLP